jgi:hypothetical protein
VSLVTEETIIALRNYNWPIRNRGLDDVTLDWDSGTPVYGHGGTIINTLIKRGFTPTT